DKSCGRKCPHTSRRALCKSRTPQISPPSSRFLREPALPVPSVPRLSGIFRAAARVRVARKTLRRNAAQCPPPAATYCPQPARSASPVPDKCTRPGCRPECSLAIREQTSLTPSLADASEKAPSSHIQRPRDESTPVPQQLLPASALSSCATVRAFPATQFEKVPWCVPRPSLHT